MLLSISDSRVSAETKSSGTSTLRKELLKLNHFVRCKLCPSNWQGSRPSHWYHHLLSTLRFELCQVILQSTWSRSHWRASPSRSRHAPCFRPSWCSWCPWRFRLSGKSSSPPRHGSRILRSTSPRPAQHSPVWV